MIDIRKSLLELNADCDYAVRYAAVHRISVGIKNGNVKAADVLDTMVHDINDADTDFALEIIWAIGELRVAADSAVPKLLARLNESEEPSIRCACACACALIGSLDQVQPVLEDIIVNDFYFQFLVFETLETIGSDAARLAPALAERVLAEPDCLAASALISVSGFGAGETFIRLLESEQLNRRWAGALLLCDFELCSKEIIQILRKMVQQNGRAELQDRVNEVRKLWENCLNDSTSFGETARGRDGDAEVLRREFLHDGLENSHDNVRLEAARRIAKTDAPLSHALNKLLAALNDDVDGVKESVAVALARIGPPAVPGLLHCLSTADPSSHFYPLDTIARMGSAASNAMPAIIDRLAMNDDRTGQCFETIARIASEETPQAIPFLIDGLEFENPHVQVACAEALNRLAEIASSALPRLNEISKRTNIRDEVRVAVRAAIHAQNEAHDQT